MAAGMCSRLCEACASSACASSGSSQRKFPYEGEALNSVSLHPSLQAGADNPDLTWALRKSYCESSMERTKVRVRLISRLSTLSSRLIISYNKKKYTRYMYIIVVLLYPTRNFERSS